MLEDFQEYVIPSESGERVQFREEENIEIGFKIILILILLKKWSKA